MAVDTVILPDGRTLHKMRVTGDGNMATVGDAAPSPRFGLDEPFTLEYMRGWAWGGSASTTPLTIYQKIRSQPSGVYDRVIRDFADFRTGGNDEFIDWRIQADERQHWTWGAGDLIVPGWTNPDSGTMNWAWEVGLATVGRNAAR